MTGDREHKDPLGALMVLPALALPGLFVFWPAVSGLGAATYSWTGFTPSVAYVDGEGDVAFRAVTLSY